MRLRLYLNNVELNLEVKIMKMNQLQFTKLSQVTLYAQTPSVHSVKAFANTLVDYATALGENSPAVRRETAEDNNWAHSGKPIWENNPKMLSPIHVQFAKWHPSS